MFARRSVLVVLNSLVGAMLGYVALFAMARFMGDELVGGRAYVLALVYLFGLVCRLGFPTTHARRLARGDDVAASMGTYLALKLFLTAGFVVVTLAAGTIWFGLLGRGVEDVTVQALWLGVAVVVAKSLKDVAVNTFRGLQRIRFREATLLANTIVTVAGTLVAALAYAQGRGRWSPVPRLSEAAADGLGVTGPVGFEQALLWLMTAFLAGEVVALALGVVLLWVARVPVGRPRRDVARDYLVATLPIMLVSVAAILMRRMDQVMIGFWFDNAEVGHYEGATKLSEFVLILANGVRVALLPVISSLHKEGRLEEVGRVIIQTERWISILVWPILLVGWTATRPTIHIVLSDAFLAAAPMMVILLGNSLLVSLTVPLRTKAFGFGEQAFAGRAALLALGTNLVLNLVLIPESIFGVPLFGLGGVGASIATLVAGAVMLVAYRGKAHDWTRHPYLSHHLRVHLLAGGVTYLALMLVAPMLPEVARFWHLLLYGGGVVALFWGLLWLLRELTVRELRDAWRMVAGRSPKKDAGVGPP